MFFHLQKNKGWVVCRERVISLIPTDSNSKTGTVRIKQKETVRYQQFDLFVF